VTSLPTVLVADARGPAFEAVLKLAALAERGLVRPFWYVEGAMPAAEPWTATYFDRWGETEVPLYSSLGERETDGVRVAAVATAVDLVESSRIAEVGDIIIRHLDALAPTAASIRTARIWFPGWDDLEQPDPDFFVPSVHANVVVVPEDRRSDQFVASPLGGAGGVFAGHIAAELAVLTGAFVGMDDAPLDRMAPGVIFGSSPKVRLARSFVRIAQSPVIPLQTVVEHEGRLPVPPGTLGAPAPEAAVADLVERSAPLLEGLVFEVCPPAPPERQQMGPGRTLLLVLKEMGTFVVSLPRRALAGVLEDFSELAGRTMQDLVGYSSVVEVVWRGKLKTVDEPEALDTQIDDLKQQAERRLDLHGGPTIDQTVWRDIRSLVLAAVDGGDLPGGLEPVEVRGRRAVIDEAAMIGPRPGDTLVETAAAMLDETESASPRTLLGRLGARVGEVAAANRRATTRLLERLDEDVSHLASYRPPSLALAHVVGSVLLAALVVGVLLFSGVVRNVGVTEMGDVAKNSAFGMLTVGCVLLLNLFRTYARQAVAEHSPKGEHSRETSAAIGWGGTLGGAVVGVLAASLFVGIGVATLGYPATDAATWAALVAGAVTGGGLGQAFTLGQRQQDLAPLGRMARLSTLAVLGYVSLLLIGAIAQADGWYANATTQELSDLLWPTTWALASLLVSVLVWVSWRRVRERLTVHSYGVSIRSLAEQVNDALVGDRVADAAREQFLGLAAVLARVVWFPYGRAGAVPTERLKVDGFGVNKAAFCEFGLSERGQALLEARTRSMAAERGWLTAQYERSIASYRSAAAVLTGATEPGSVGRPDEDPATVAQLDLDKRAERADRWRWADDLFAGKYDGSLLAALESFGEDEVFRPILADSENFEPIKARTEERSLAAFIAEILPVAPAKVDPRYFDPAHLAGAGFSRDWHPRVWWPEERLFSPVVDDHIERIEPRGSMAHGRVWLAIRADLTEDLEPAALYGDAPRREPDPPAPGPEF